VSSSTPSSVKTLLNSLSDVSFVLNESMSVQSMSVGSGVLRNLPRDDMIGRRWLDLVRESDKAIVSEALQTALATPEQAHRADAGLLVGSETEPVPVTCWLCACAETQTVAVACVDLRGEEGKVVSEFSVDETILATAAISGNGLYIRSDQTLWKFGK